MLASSSQTTPLEFTFVSLPTITDAPPNTHIFWLEPSETHRGYGCHVFHPTGRRILDKQAVPVIYHQGAWYTLRHKAGNSFPHLGAERPDISLYDVQPQMQIETPKPETPEPLNSPTEPPISDSKSIPDPEDDSLLRAIRLTPLASPITVTSRVLPLMATTTTTTSTQTATLATTPPQHQLLRRRPPSQRLVPPPPTSCPASNEPYDVKCQEEREDQEVEEVEEVGEQEVEEVEEDLQPHLTLMSPNNLPNKPRM